MEWHLSMALISQENFFNHSARKKEQYPNYWMVLCKQIFCCHRKCILRCYKQSSWAFLKCTWSSQFCVHVFSSKKQKKIRGWERWKNWEVLSNYTIKKKSPKPYLNFLVNIKLDWMASTEGTLSMRAPKSALFLQ